MVKSEIHSRRRKHKYGHFGGKLEPTSPGSLNPGNMSLPYAISSNQQSPPGMLSQTLPGSFPESPSGGTNKDGCDTNQQVNSAVSSPEPGQEPEKSLPTDGVDSSADPSRSSPGRELSCEFDAEESAEEAISESPVAETQSSDVAASQPPMLSSQ